MSDARRWQRVKALFQAAVERPPAERAAFVAAASADDDDVRVVFDAGHMMFPRGPMTEEILAWLNQHLGSVTTSK